MAVIKIRKNTKACMPSIERPALDKTAMLVECMKVSSLVKLNKSSPNGKEVRESQVNNIVYEREQVLLYYRVVNTAS